MHCQSTALHGTEKYTLYTPTALVQSQAKPGDVVVIQGLGGLGHLALQYASKMGFVVVGYSGSPEKKDLAFKLGAHHYISSKDDVSRKPIRQSVSPALLTDIAS